MTDTIKECPFCGGVPKFEKRKFENPNAGYSGSDYYLVVCTKCEAAGKYEVFEYFSMFSKYSVEEFRKNNEGSFIAMEAIRTLIQKTKAKYILLSYSSGGRATKKELETILNETGKVLKIIEIDYKKNIMASMRWTNEWLNATNENDNHKEYLFLMEKLPIKSKSEKPKRSLA